MVEHEGSGLETIPGDCWFSMFSILAHNGEYVFKHLPINLSAICFTVVSFNLTSLSVHGYGLESYIYIYIYHCKNTWVTLTIFFMSSQLHQCDKGMLPNWKSF